MIRRKPKHRSPQQLTRLFLYAEERYFLSYSNFSLHLYLATSHAMFFAGLVAPQNPHPNSHHHPSQNSDLIQK